MVSKFCLFVEYFLRYGKRIFSFERRHTYQKLLQDYLHFFLIPIFSPPFQCFPSSLFIPFFRAGTCPKKILRRSAFFPFTIGRITSPPAPSVERRDVMMPKIKLQSNGKDDSLFGGGGGGLGNLFGSFKF